MTSRRHLMKMLGLAPVAAGSARSEITTLLSSTVSAQENANIPMSMGTALIKKFGPLLGVQIDDVTRNYQMELSARQSLRGSGLVDADIQCLRSLSMTYKHRKQFERDVEDNSLNQRINNLIWGP